MTTTSKTVEIEPTRCKSCGLCIHFCPKGALVLGDEINCMGYNVVVLKGDSQCNGCGLCRIICPDVALNVPKKKMK